MKKSIVKALRTDCISGATQEIDITIVARKYNCEFIKGWWYAIIKGGVTGHESCRVDGFDLEDGWTACAGTQDVWDILFVPEESCRQFINELSEEINKKG